MKNKIFNIVIILVVLITPLFSVHSEEKPPSLLGEIENQTEIMYI